MTSCFVYKVIKDLESIDHLFIYEALPGVLGNRGKRVFISGEQRVFLSGEQRFNFEGNRETKTILGNREHK